MNIKQLKEFIEALPDDMQVCSRDTKWNRDESECYIAEEWLEESGTEVFFLVIE